MKLAATTKVEFAKTKNDRNDETEGSNGSGISKDEK